MRLASSLEHLACFLGLAFNFLFQASDNACQPMESGSQMPLPWLSSNRTHCPHCGAALCEPIFKEGKRQRGIVSCQIVAEPKTLQAYHVSRWCQGEGKGVRYWCGFLEKPFETRGRRILVKILDQPHADYFLLNNSWGVAHTAETVALSNGPPQSLVPRRRSSSLLA